MPNAFASATASIDHSRFVTSARPSSTGPATAKQAASTGRLQRVRNSVSSASKVGNDRLSNRSSTATAPSSTQRRRVFVPPTSPAMMRIGGVVYRHPDPAKRGKDLLGKILRRLRGSG